MTEAMRRERRVRVPKARAGRPLASLAGGRGSMYARVRNRGTMTAALVAGLLPGGLSARQLSAPLPFRVGENLTYAMKFGVLHVGSGTLTVTGMKPLDSDPLIHFTVAFRGGTLLFHVNDAFESSFDPDAMRSVRFVQTLNEGSSHVHHAWAFCPGDTSMFDETADSTALSVSEPLDDASFLFFIRTIPLEPGKTYRFDRYFRRAENPVTVTVLRRERVTVPAGTFDAIVIQPVVNNDGIFGASRRAEVWIAEDPTRVLLKIRSRLPFALLTLALESWQPGTGPVQPHAAGETARASRRPQSAAGSPAVAAGAGCSRTNASVPRGSDLATGGSHG